MKLIRILILEDDLKTLSKLLNALHQLEEELINAPDNKDIAVTVLSEYTQVEQYINSDKKHLYDVVLLDRDCKAGGSFHTLDFNKIGVEKIISISSIPQYNDEAEKLGVTKVVHKNYDALDTFLEQVIGYIREII